MTWKILLGIMVLFLYLFMITCSGASMMGQLNWTPINFGESNQVDMWTKESKGCDCQYNTKLKDCACCVKPGGCQCGTSAPNKCAQCGLQQYCNNMCNATIRQDVIHAESRMTVGQIKSPSLQGPTLCWYLLQPDIGHRLELQIYRLVNVGRFNGTGCQSGYIHLIDEIDVKSGSSGVQICGENERFSPPVVLFADRGAATLTFRIEETTARSQFLIHYSFTAYNNTQGVGFRPTGGKRNENKTCEWLYQDYNCANEKDGCILASPGYPGVYPSHATCRYHITINSLRTKVKIIFTALSLPLNHCATDYISIYQGTSSSSPLLTTICSNKKQELIFSGPDLMIEFKSGVSIPPYDYNGFVAKLVFVEKPGTTEISPVLSITTTRSVESRMQNDKSSKRTQVVPTVRIEEKVTSTVQSPMQPCRLIIYGNSTRSGHFDTRSLPQNNICSLIFIGQPNDLIHISLFNYKVSGSSCLSYIEIIDGNVMWNQPYKSIKKLCSPVTKHARNSEGKFHEQQTFLSTNNYLSIYFKRHKLKDPESDLEYLDGAFSFLNEYAEGTLQPNTLCDVTYYGLTSSSSGKIQNHGSQHLFWNVEGPLRCVQRFVPTSNQSIILRVTSLQRLASNVCHTECGDSGCQCVINQDLVLPNNTAQYDHLLILNEYNVALSCICGYFREEWLPIIIRSWSPVTIMYSVAKYSWAEKGFSFEADYLFVYDGACGYRFINHHSGSIQSIKLRESSVLNYYYNQKCTWILNSNIERQLFVEISSTQNRPCNAWNITVYQYDENSKDHVGDLLHVFCPRDIVKAYNLPWKLNIIVLKLSAMTRTLPHFQIKWTSQVIRTDTRLSVLSPEAASGADISASVHILNIIIASLMILSRK